MLQLWPNGESKRVLIGSDLEQGMAPQVIVPRGVWQGARLAEGRKTGAARLHGQPGIRDADYESGGRDTLRAAVSPSAGFDCASDEEVALGFHPCTRQSGAGTWRAPSRPAIP